jgi:hypothetical protein
VGLGCKIDNGIDAFINKQLLKQFPVIDITAHKPVTGCRLYFGQVFQVSRIGQQVKVDNPVVRVLPDPVAYKIGSNEAGTTGN